MIRPAAALLAVVSLIPLAHAQSGKTFDKAYELSGRPDLQVLVDNSSVHAQSCGSCREIKIHVDARDYNLSDFRISESQSGNIVRFSMKQKEGFNWHMGRNQSPEVTISLPGEAAVKLQSSNGALELAGVSGNVDLRTDNGRVNATDTRGSLRAVTDNGRITLQHVQGTVVAHTDNGAIDGDGRFADLEAKTSNGSVHLAVLDASGLSGGIRVSTNNGSVHLQVPRSTHANVDLRSGLGAIRSNLSLSSDGSDEHHKRGTVNGGGSVLRVTTGNGSINVEGV